MILTAFPMTVFGNDARANLRVVTAPFGIHATDVRMVGVEFNVDVLRGLTNLDAFFLEVNITPNNASRFAPFASGEDAAIRTAAEAGFDAGFAALWPFVSGGRANHMTELLSVESITVAANGNLSTPVSVIVNGPGNDFVVAPSAGGYTTLTDLVAAAHAAFTARRTLVGNQAVANMTVPNQVNIAAGSGSNQALLDWLSTPPAVSFSHLSGNMREGVISFGSFNLADLPSNANGTIRVNIPVIINYNPTYLRANLNRTGTFDTDGRWVTGRNIDSFGTTRIDRFDAYTSLNITAGDARYFARDIFALPNVIFSERTFGNFGFSTPGFAQQGPNLTAEQVAPDRVDADRTGWTLVRLEAPRGYRWHLTQGFHPEVYWVDRSLRWGNLSPLNTPEDTPTRHVVPEDNFHRRQERVNNVRVDVLYIQVPTNVDWNRNRMPRAFQLRNLHLVTDEDQPLGEVNIHAATIIQVPHRTVANENVTRPRDVNRFWTATSLHVGTRVPQGLGIERLNDMPILRTGYVALTNGATGEDVDGNELIVITENTADPLGLQTATIRIYERAPGAWTSDFGDTLDFTFEQAGVDVIGAVARIGYNNRAWRMVPGVLVNAPDNNNAPWRYQWLGGWMPFGEHILENARRNIEEVVLTPGRVRVTVPPLTRNYSTDQGRARRTEVRSLEITFWVSVSGGFEWQNPGDNIEVTVGGAGAAGLPEALSVVEIARPQDPVSLHLPDGPVDLGTHTLATIANHQISDILITVYEPHLLREGSSFVINIGGVELANRAFGLHIHAGEVSFEEDNVRGFVLGEPERVAAGGLVATAGSGFAIPIRRVPDENVNEGPITIRLSDVRVSGTVVPDVEYYVILSGSAVSENFWNQGTITAPTPGGQAAPGVGRFSIEPYFQIAASYYEGIILDQGPDGGVLGPVRELRLWEGMGPLAIAPDVNVPFFWHIVHPNRIGMVSLRVFGAFVGDSNPVWDQATGTAQVTGTDVHGNDLVVAVQRDNPIAAIQRAGQPVQNIDIATSVNFLSGPAGTVVPVFVNDRIYLPLRFFAETFGYTVHMEGNVVVFR